MTGYGKSLVRIREIQYSIELKSLNGKFLDLSIKLPNNLRYQEMEIRNLLAEILIRGKADLIIEPTTGGQPLYCINKTAFRKYYQELEDLTSEMNIPYGNITEIIMQLPDVLSTAADDLNDTDIHLLLKGLKEACHALDTFRIQEGLKMEQDIIPRITGIQNTAREIRNAEAARTQAIRSRLMDKLCELTSTPEVNQTRLEQEILYYTERLDITEELVRLDSHCDYFLEVVRQPETAKGKKLTFITQEMGREINTLGAKANDAAIQKKVVLMKDELEKVKELLNNVL